MQKDLQACEAVNEIHRAVIQLAVKNYAGFGSPEKLRERSGKINRFKFCALRIWADAKQASDKYVYPRCNHLGRVNITTGVFPCEKCGNQVIEMEEA